MGDVFLWFPSWFWIQPRLLQHHFRCRHPFSPGTTCNQHVGKEDYQTAQAIEGNAQIEIEVRMTNWQNYSSTAHALAQASWRHERVQGWCHSFRRTRHQERHNPRRHPKNLLWWRESCQNLSGLKDSTTTSGFG